MTSVEPNLQNIPARDGESKNIRSLFISRFEGGKILAADYSQIELRLLAHFSSDESMKSAFQTNRDIHLETASKVFAVDSSDSKPGSLVFNRAVALKDGFKKMDN